jgi:large subunit ribosomal protein L10
MARSDKNAAVAELTEDFRSSAGALLTEYRGLTVKQLQELRRSLADNASYAVVKNTLTKIAARDAGVDSFEEQLSGPSAIAFITGDAVLAAKGLRDFARANPALVIKAGVLDGKPLTASEIVKLADLESREVLLAKLAGAMAASLQGAVGLFAAPLSQTARLVEALRAQTEQAQPEPAAAVSEPSEPVTQEPAAASEPLEPAAASEPLEPAAASELPEPAAASEPPATGEIPPDVTPTATDKAPPPEASAPPSPAS